MKALIAPVCLVRVYGGDGDAQVGEVFTMKMFGNRITFLIGPDAHSVFFRASDEEADQAAVYKFMTPVFGRGVVRES